MPVRAAAFRDDQNTSFIEPCRTRCAPALVICPKVLDEMLAFGPPKLTWFSELNASARVCRVSHSRSRNERLSAISTVNEPGARRLLWPALPNVPIALAVKRPGFRY